MEEMKNKIIKINIDFAVKKKNIGGTYTTI